MGRGSRSGPISTIFSLPAQTDTLVLFKRDLLTRFDGTDEGEIEQYLGCEVIFDSEGRKVTLRQKVYTELVLRAYCMWGCTLVKTPLEPGTRLSKAD